MAEINKKNLLNEKLKAKEAEEKNSKVADSGKPVALDDASRVKVLSPSRLILKRFFRNKLAIVGMVLLITLFSLSFIGPLFYPYGQLEKFSTVKRLDLDYAVCGVPSSFNKYLLADNPAAEDVKNFVDSFIRDLEAGDSDSLVIERDGGKFVISRDSESTYLLKIRAAVLYTYDSIALKAKRGEPSAEVDALIKKAIEKKETSFEKDGVKYTITRKSKTESAVSAEYPEGEEVSAIIATKLTFDAIEKDYKVDQKMIAVALQHIHRDNAFEFEGRRYTIVEEGGENARIVDDAGKAVIEVLPFSIRDVSGKDSLSADFKIALSSAVVDMESRGERSGSFNCDVPQLNVDTKEYVTDENGNIILENEEIRIKRKEVSGEVR